jgi:hypothetical protein
MAVRCFWARQISPSEFCGRICWPPLRRANIDAAAGSVEEVARIVAQVRRRWPLVRILLRADSDFAREELKDHARAPRGVLQPG